MGSKNRQKESLLEGPVPEITPEQRARVIAMCEALAKSEDEKAMFGGMLLGNEHDLAS